MFCSDEIEVGDQRQSIVSIFHRRRILGTRIQILSIGGAKSVFNITHPLLMAKRGLPTLHTNRPPKAQPLSLWFPYRLPTPQSPRMLPPHQACLLLCAPLGSPPQSWLAMASHSPPAGSFVAVLIGAQHACQHEFDVEVAEWRDSQSATPSLLLVLCPKESQWQSATAKRWINRILAIVVTLLSVVTTDILLAEESSEVLKSCRIFDKLEIFRNQLC